ncbi:MAG: BNR repeat-containing glycosyl hydrolase, partial [bacterium]
NIQSTKARIRVEATDINNLTGRDISDADFIITGKDTTPPQVTVISPNGGEVLANSDALKITWRASDNVGVFSQDIQVSNDGGSNYTTLQAGLAGNIQEFTLNIPSISERTKVKIIARDTQNNVGSDDSDGVFAVLAKPSISNAKYNNNARRLMVFATTISVNTEVTINGKVIPGSKKIKANTGALILKGSLSDLNLRSGDNILMIKERGLASGAFKLNLP